MSLSHLSFPLHVAEDIHMSISTIMIVVKTGTLTMGNRRGNRRRCQWHRSSKTSSRRTGNQDRRRLQEASNMNMSLLIMNHIKSIHQEDTCLTSKQLGTKRLKLITKSSQEVISAMKLKSSLLILA
jgi:hypothetical protein